jgi:hypothetical protein
MNEIDINAFTHIKKRQYIMTIEIIVKVFMDYRGILLLSWYG